MQIRLNRHFPKEVIQMANTPMRRCLIASKLIIKAILIHHFTPTSIAIIKGKERKAEGK